MLTYAIMALAVALLAGLTGGMPAPLQSPRQAGPRGGTKADGCPSDGPSSEVTDVERSLPSEIPDALAAARLRVAGQAIEGSPGSANVDVPATSAQPPAFAGSYDPGHVAPVASGGKLLDEIVDALVRGTQFVAVSGGPGTGKTIMAARIREELTKRSVSVRSVDGHGGSGIALRAIMSRVLDKPEAGINSEDIEQLFDAMTEREAADERLVLIIDDAELLLSDAIAYLGLLASVAMQRMPQIVFVGDPSFFGVAARTRGFTELIAARFELASLSREQVAAEEPVAMIDCAGGSVLDQTVVDDVPQHSEGLFGRLVSFVASTRAIAIHPVWNGSRGGKSVVRMAGAAALVVGLVFVPTHRLTLPGVERVTLGEKEIAVAQPRVADSPSPIIVRLPSPAIAVRDFADLDTPSARIVRGPALKFDIAELPSRSDPQFSTAIAPRKPGKARAVERQRPFASSYAHGATSGTWLFQTSLFGGANS